jgi:hypothetical protein
MNLYTQGSSATGYTTYIAITAGETVALSMALSANSTAINLTGYTLKCQINAPAPLALNTTNGGITVTNAAQGDIQLTISSTQSAAIPVGVYRFDLWMTSSGGVETPLLNGNFSVTPNISPVP